MNTTGFRHAGRDDIGVNFSATQWALPPHIEWHNERDYFVCVVRVLCVSLVMVRWRA